MFTGVLCSIAGIMYAIYSFGHNLDLIFDNLHERCARFNLSVMTCIGNSRTICWNSARINSFLLNA